MDNAIRHRGDVYECFLAVRAISQLYIDGSGTCPLTLTVYLTASDIVARFGGQVRLSAVQVGKALQEMGIEQYRSHYGRFWKLFERAASDIGHVVPDDIQLTKEEMPF